MTDKVVLAFSGGLDTSVILKWLKDERNYDVVTFTADIGQGEELEQAKKIANQMGASEVFVEDLKEEFVKDYVFPMLRANTVYEGNYLLGTSIARPLIAKRQIEIAETVGAKFVAHGATGKGNDQVRFELAYLAHNPDINIIAPWREWELSSRTKLIAYAESKGIPIHKDKYGEPPYSMDANMLHVSYEGKVLEDPWIEADEEMYTRTVSIDEAPASGEVIIIGYESGDPNSLNGIKLSPASLLNNLNILAGKHGIGRIDIVENRYVGMKSRGVYETPGGTVLLKAHRAIESLTLDGPSCHLKDDLMPRFAEIIYNGLWFSPEREMLQALIDQSQRNVNGEVRLRLHKGSVEVIGRRSEKSLYSKGLATFEDDDVFDQKDAEGFIKLNSIRLRQRKFSGHF